MTDLLVPHPCPVPDDPEKPDGSYRWVCPGCHITWHWRRPVRGIPRVRTVHYGFLWLKTRKEEVPDPEPWPGRWTHSPDETVWVPQSSLDKDT